MKITQHGAIVLTALGLMIFLTSCTTPQSAEIKSAAAPSNLPPTRRLPLDSMSNPCVCDCDNLVTNGGFEDFILNTCPGSQSDESHIHTVVHPDIELKFWEVSTANGVSLLANAGSANDAINVPGSAASFFNTPHGNQFAVIGHHGTKPATSLSQKIGRQLKANKNYQISFYQSATTPIPSGSIPNLGGRVEVRVLDSNNQPIKFTFPDNGATVETLTVLKNVTWTKQTLDFSIPAGPDVFCTIQFTDVPVFNEDDLVTGPIESVAVIDNVVLCEVLP